MLRKIPHEPSKERRWPRQQQQTDPVGRCRPASRSPGTETLTVQPATGVVPHGGPLGVHRQRAHRPLREARLPEAGRRLPGAARHARAAADPARRRTCRSCAPTRRSSPTSTQAPSRSTSWCTATTAWRARGRVAPRPATSAGERARRCLPSRPGRRLAPVRGRRVRVPAITAALAVLPEDAGHPGRRAGRLARRRARAAGPGQGRAGVRPPQRRGRRRRAARRRAGAGLAVRARARVRARRGAGDHAPCAAVPVRRARPGPRPGLGVRATGVGAAPRKGFREWKSDLARPGGRRAA
jgi:hypothetical protein